jgi:hypothetical protein
MGRRIDHQSRAPIEGAGSQNTALVVLDAELAIEERMHKWYVNIYKYSGLLRLRSNAN